MPDLLITSVNAYEVTIPIEAPIRHSYGVHEAFTRTVIEISTADGVMGLGETAAPAGEVMSAGQSILGLSAFDLGLIRMRISQRFYWSQDPLIISGIEMALIDIQARAAGVPAHKILGGALRESVPLAAYCFFRYASEDGKQAAVTTPSEMADHAADLVARYGFKTVKLKAGVLSPDVEIAALRAIRARLPNVELRIDPNAAWTPTTAISLLPALEEIGIQYLEDPSPGQAGMAQVRSRTRLPFSTNMCVVDFSDIPGAMSLNAVDVILSDPWYWGGPTRTQALAQICQTFGLGLGMHSGIELGIGMAVMAHTAVTIPNLTMAIDAHYHHMTDDVIVGDRILPSDGSGNISPPTGPGWGVELDRDAIDRYRALHASGRYVNLYVQGSSSGPDFRRPGWHPVMPSW